MSSNPEVPSRAKHRRFSADEKAIERAAILRRAGVYSSLISNWRKQLAAVPTPPKRGRPSNPEAAELARLRQENDRLQRRLDKSERMLDALGKVHALLQQAAGESAQDEQPSKRS
jgi:transposase